ncbi:MAG: GNAT family N-acetyltransferase [Atopobiaceae bacterium]|nr:GNAT family N-acetyltransferase [Atopobiaceae bacterium]
MQHKGTQRLLTSRLELRRLTLADAEQMYAHWAADREVTRFLTWPPHATVDVTRGVLEEWVAGYASDDFYQWGIVLNETSELVGTISVVSIDDDVDAVEIGYCLGRAWWSKGIMTEALRRIIAFFFDEVGANRVCAKHDVDNPASGAVMAKCGMRREGVRRAGARSNRGIVDVACYALLAEDARA